MIQEVTNGEQVLAIIIPSDFRPPGVNFFTPDESPIQLGLLDHPKAKTIAPHVHTGVPREVINTQEVLILRRGKLRVDFYDQEETYLHSRILSEGDTILLMSGGHGFEVLEDVEMIEVKTGPYLGADNKKRFGPNLPDELKVID
jgi:anti-sigma factor ChrR (cupin superfamily)